jgi:hypothetical protein
MSAVMIKCPNTGRAVSTQIETEPCVFEKLPSVLSRTTCPVCGEVHVWTRKQAWLAEEFPARRTGTYD